MYSSLPKINLDVGVTIVNAKGKSNKSTLNQVLIYLHCSLIKSAHQFYFVESNIFIYFRSVLSDFTAFTQTHNQFKRLTFNKSKYPNIYIFVEK